MMCGCVHVITGDGKGKTSAGMGMVLRALGRGFSVFVMQFMKDGSSGEMNALRELSTTVAGEISLNFCGLPGFLRKGAVDPESVRQAGDGLKTVRKAMEAAGASGRKWLFLLDECNVAMDFDLLESSDILALMDSLPGNVELVLTGRKAPVEIMKKADYVSEILPLKHPYDKGMAQREGIEY